jgi:hypothetical protein
MKDPEKDRMLGKKSSQTTWNACLLVSRPIIFPSLADHFYLSKGGFFYFFIFHVHCFICRPSDSTVSENALALTARRSNHSARSHTHSAVDLINSRIDLIHTRLDLIHTRPDLIHTWLDLTHLRLNLIQIRLDLIHIRLDLIHTRLDLIHTRLDLIHTRLYSPTFD